MSRELIHAWLDGEIDEDGAMRLESWLRVDSSHRREFLQAVALEEDLRSAYRQRQPMRFESPAPSPLREWLQFMRRGWIPITGLAAVIVLVRLVGIESPPPEGAAFQWQAGTEQPVDPTPAPLLMAAKEPVRVLRGDLQVESVPADSARQAGAAVKSGETSGLVRWGDDLELDLEPNTGLLLTAHQPGQEPSPVAVDRAITLAKGRVRVRCLTEEMAQEPTATTRVVQVVTPAGRILAGNAEFVVASSSAPFGTAVTVTVASGQVRVVQPKSQQTVRAGETVVFKVP
jgi:ferric-dicitrate binding protein FerR (iron transport regulator)